VGLDGTPGLIHTLTIQTSQTTRSSKLNYHWPQTPEENLERLKVAGFVVASNAVVCRNCGGVFRRHELLHKHLLTIVQLSVMSRRIVKHKSSHRSNSSSSAPTAMKKVILHVAAVIRGQPWAPSQERAAYATARSTRPKHAQINQRDPRSPVATAEKKDTGPQNVMRLPRLLAAIAVKRVMFYATAHRVCAINAVSLATWLLLASSHRKSAKLAADTVSRQIMRPRIVISVGARTVATLVIL
jgi:hypothetical protein